MHTADHDLRHLNAVVAAIRERDDIVLQRQCNTPRVHDLALPAPPPPEFALYSQRLVHLNPVFLMAEPLLQLHRP